MTFVEILQFTSIIITFPISIALLFAVIIQPQRTRTNWYFFAFASAFALWGFGSLVKFFEEPVIFVDNRSERYLQVSGIILTMVSYGIFIFHFANISAQLRTRLMTSLGIIGALAVIFTWTNIAFDYDTTEHELMLKPVGYLLITVNTIYLGGGYYLLRKSRTPQTQFLELPTLIFMGGIISNSIPALVNVPGDALSAAFALVVIGWHVLREQMFNPMQEMVTSLQEANERITEEKRVIEKLNAELKQNNRYKTEFLANMSHELRTPLNAIIGYSDLLRDNIYGELNDNQRDRIHKIRRNGHHLLALINDVLDISKIEAGKFTLHAETFDILKLIPELQNYIEPMIEEKSLEFIVDVPPNLPTVYADVVRIKQVLINFLSNAVKFTHAGSVTLKMVVEDKSSTLIPSLLARSTVDQWLIISVEDTGIGIDTNQFEQIFEAFRQADGSSTRKYGGTGLGLAIAKRLIELHGGSVWVNSTSNEGSQFFMALPLHEQVSGLNPEADTPTILVIEDQADAGEVLCEQLRSVGWQAVWAQGGQKGLELAESLQPDLITVDIMMPGMNGWETITHLKSNEKTTHIPIIIISMIDDTAQTLEVGANDYLVKPVQQNVLLETIRNLIDDDHPSALIWTVDDDPSEREIISTYLRDHYRTQGVPGGAEALQLLDNPDLPLPSLILLDLMMPKVSGFEVLNHIRTTPRLRHMPVLIVTTKSLTADEQIFLQANMATVLAKHGLTDKKLIEQIRQTLTRANLKQKAVE